jgi:hypothetical protein
METDRPARTIVCLCGSTRFLPEFETANRNETLKGKIVVTIGVDLKVRDRAFREATNTPAQLEEIKKELDRLHKDKVRLADEVLVLDIDGPHNIGTSTQEEVDLATSLGKKVRWWSEEGGLTSDQRGKAP